MAIKLSFGQWIKARRKALDMTQHDLAHRIGCAPSTIQKIELNARQPSRQMATLLADHLAIAPAEREAFLHLARHQSAHEPANLPIAPPLQSPLNNLPTPLTSLVGREWEIATLWTHLQQTTVRLLTITGPPGVGKTRLALAAAQMLATEAEASRPPMQSDQPLSADGVCFVALASISDVALIVVTILRALGLKDTGSQPPLAQLKAFLNHKKMLLVLDNFEHLLAAAPMLAELLEAAPHLKLLVTSRALLQLYGEHEFVTPPLAVPDLKHLPTVDKLTGYPAVELFVQRARAAKLEFILSEENAATVAILCAHLDGLPLAIELAAARSKALSPEALLARLMNPYDRPAAQVSVLRGSARNLPPRQQTLHNAIEWSYQLLNPTEQQVFRHLGVFTGGCSVEAMEAVVTRLLSVNGHESLPTMAHLSLYPEHWLVLTLQSLVNHSLVIQQPVADGTSRFLMLAMLREYALEQLDQHNEAEAAQRAHALYFLHLAQKYEHAHAEGKGRAPGVFTSTEREVDNLRSALHWATGHDIEVALQLTTAMAGFWSSRHYLTEGRQWLERLLPRLKADMPLFTDQQIARFASFLSLVAFVTWQQGDLALAQVRFAESITLWRQLQNRLELGMALQFQALIFFNQGDCLAACISAEESVAILRAIDESWQLAIALKNLGRIQLVQGDAIAARAFIEESIDIMQRRTNSWGVSNGLLALSEVAFAQYDCCSAFTYLAEALHYYQSTNETWFLAQTQLAMGKVLWCQGNKAQAATLWNESILLAREAGAKQFLSSALFMAGLSAQENGDLQEARIHLKESLALFQMMGNQAGVAYTLSGLASISSQVEQSVKVLGAVSTILATTRLPMDQIERAHYEQTIATVRGQLDETTFAAVWSEGKTLSMPAALALALDCCNH